MVRRLIAIVTVVSLLLCAATIVLWVRSWRHPPLEEDRYSWLAGNGDRLTMRSDAGQIALFAPPAGNVDAVAAISSVGHRTPLGLDVSTREEIRQSVRTVRAANGPLSARQIAALLRNEQLTWFVGSPNPSKGSEKYVYPLYGYETPPFLLGNRDDLFWWVPDGASIPRAPRVEDIPSWWHFSKNDATAALLLALEDPDRFVAAHLLLLHWHGFPVESFEDVDGANRIHFQRDGLGVDLTLQAEPNSHWDPAATYDVGQLARIRDQWHRRLDVSRGSSPWWLFTAGTAVLPFVWLTTMSRRRLIRRSRRRSGRCVVCGYDLRASSGCCPECGAAA